VVTLDVLNVLNDVTDVTKPDQWRSVIFGVVTVAILLVAWCYHVRTQPYAYRYQNAIESWLYASSIVLLVLGIIYKAISDALRNESTLGNGLDVAMLVVLVGSFVGPILWSVREELTITRVLDSFSLVEMLLLAEKQIDGPIRERLADGSIRLLSCAWLLSKDSDKYLGHDASGF